MGKWSIIEDKINKFLVWFYSILKNSILKIIPVKVKTLASSSIIKVNVYFNNKYTTIKNTILEFLVKRFNSLNKVKVFFRETLRTVFQTLDQLKNVNVKKIKYKEKFLSLKSTLIISISSSENRVVILFKKIGIQNLKALSVLFIVGVLSLSHIYSKSKKILINTGVVRAPASVPAVKVYPKVRPSYYKRNERQLFIRGVRFPVYVGSKTSSTSLTMDITVITSNKYTKAYLNENHYIVKDAFNSKIEPIIPSFPLETEGKDILKTKIEKELNKLIKKYKIEGEIEDVHIHAITAG